MLHSTNVSPISGQTTIRSAILCFLIACSSTTAQERVWTEATGKFKVAAEFVELQKNQVVLKRVDSGKHLTIPLNRLVEDDQKLAQQLHAKNIETKTLDIKLSAKTKWSTITELDDQNKPKPPNLELSIEATGESAQQAIEFGFLKIDSLKDSAGNLLTTSKPISDFFDRSKKFEKVEKRGDDFFSKHPVNGVRIPITIVCPEASIKQIKEVKGSFKLITGGNRIKAVHKNAKTNLGAIDDSRLNTLGIKAEVKQNGLDSLQVTLTGKDLKPVYQVAVLSEDEKTIKEQNGSSWQGTMKKMTWTFSFDRSPPANASVFIYVATDTKTVTVPFEFNDLSVPKENRFGF